MTIIDYWRIMWRSRFLILGVTAVAIVVAFALVSSQPKVYSARGTSLMPRETVPQGLGGSLGALLSGGGRDGGGGGFSLPSLLGGGASFSTNLEMFLAVLRSRTSRNEVSTELAKKYGPDVTAKLVGVDVGVPEKGVIAVTVESTDRMLAAEAANLYFQVLDRVLERLADQAARRQERFYADQLQRAAKEVAAAEEAVLTFSTENRVIPVDGPTRNAIDPNANIRGQIMALEMQREVMRMRMTEQHPQMRELDKQITELKKHYSKNLFGAPMDLPGEAPGQRRKEFFVSTEKTTPVQFAYLKLYRNLKIQEAFYTGALQGLEQLKYSDTNRQVRVESLDQAVPPGIHTRPRVLFTVLAASLAGLVIAIVAASLTEYVRRLRLEERATRARDARLERREVQGSLAPDDALLREESFSAAGRAR